MQIKTLQKVIKETCLNWREMNLDFFKRIYSNRLVMSFYYVTYGIYCQFLCYLTLGKLWRMKLESLKGENFRVYFVNSTV